MRILTLFALCFAFASGSAEAQKPAKLAAVPATPAQDEFVIRKPGEITFTTGIVIEGRVEKPQVMLILTKERLKLQSIRFERSFVNRITEPVAYSTFELSRDKGTSDDLIR
ncbi:MAG: hypothetical protein A2268_14335 [Candidatus Raymondbacteria bacterium RifOxyA12_full_50_37]|uniref:Uncharacterized protein n=1 Tax=Candidatus Raymondbacteria bacterium RIFOXYD12_FULL_49_13 TaxID=1817890 RepID=A0A1F7FLH2_UNCRA|nr:MAG: hypothetical protein A2268_14335 [Candidatus Raymondbacteria bacterium RifOxyA12_full_50_37]OGJ86936.1 MAG: hypothetical protein A2350_02250 [Candidatus Raymondbacteria bacterium RifOxyB12_full_50_8]OGJ88258.1 MAG: hypothetical protein A2248_19675 [Candidatus Raymondbacteria bacterium RIFOXYA2_FULL_49_16]OGK07302.1 MAG: hypothetical protein A2519_14350 [Candidatus Raymondbacteria bacterium RIFOXYD12_FULL_49_13]OGK08046.1 MAG: hypothetical protein A2487_10455 [Candidatus Raymondbacteria 